MHTKSGRDRVVDTMKRFGLSAALTTPFRADYGIDLPRAIAQARWCLDNGCDGVTLLGTTGEGSSIALRERQAMFEGFARSGIEPRLILTGVMASAAADAADQARLALEAGYRGVLLAPPFYFKGVDDDALFAWFSQVFAMLGREARDVIVYNIPSVTAVALSVDLVSRLRSAFPRIVIGVKDSSGDWDYTQRLLAAHSDLIILIGDERHLAASMRRGAQGSICGLANVHPKPLRRVIDEGRDDERIVSLVEAVLAYPVIPAVKALVAHRTGDPEWLRARPPLTGLSAGAASRLAAVVDAALHAAA
jgi:4-hydroxy-tetrahydrodipicolinate synthase